MRYYSDVTQKFYDTQGECVKAEAEAKQKAEKEKYEKEKKDAERKSRAKEVDEALKAVDAAKKHYAELLEAFCESYGPFHTSLTGEDAKRVIPTAFDLLDLFF